MAKFLPSELISEIRNKAGASVFTRTRGGAVVRAYQPVVGNPNTVYQQAQRAAVKALMNRWRTVLTDAQRQAWELVASQTFKVDVLAQRYNLAGVSHYMAVNLTMTALALSWVDDPPLGLFASDPGPLSLVADSSLQTLVLTCTNGIGAGEVPFLRLTPGLSPAINWWMTYMRVLPFPVVTPGQTVFDLSAAWVSRFGSMPQDARIGAQLQFVNASTGSLSSIQRTSTISAPEVPDAMLISRVVLTAAQMNNLSTVPALLLAAPPTGYLIVPIFVVAKTHNTAVPFVGVGQAVIVFGPSPAGALNLAEATGGFATALNVDNFFLETSLIDEVDVPTAYEGLGIYLTVSGADYTGGDGAVSVSLGYVLVSSA